ncbi:MAG TPA: sigma-70 family RNA polymerase sigma factor [Thermoanaerobaculia bacterium]|nr:sigma-70 family RNA polymerase sigma factor [Thermoanaerobaculia bacterium]
MFEPKKGPAARVLVEEHTAEIVRAVQRVARDRALTRDLEEELLSFTFEQLLSKKAGVFEQFKGEASLETYLFRVVERLWVDLSNERWGRWRPLKRCRQLGTTAIELDRLIRREREEPRQAVARVLHSRPKKRTEETLSLLAVDLSEAARPARVSLNLSRLASADSSEKAAEDADRLRLARRLLDAMRAAIEGLPAPERQVLHRVCCEKASVAVVAKSMGLENAEVYRLKYAAFAHLKADLENQGFDADMVRQITDPDRPAVTPEGFLSALAFPAKLSGPP